tara:strand:- start:1840 stop:2067 length:228 start_codon:yes stop_codon:yes gene_type:complete
MKFKGTLERKNKDVEVFEFEEISRAKATGKMRLLIRDNQEVGVVARLFEIHRSDADFIARWDIDSNQIVCESFKI